MVQMVSQRLYAINPMHALWLHFFPHHENHHRPHALMHHHLAFTGVALVTLKLLALALITIWPTEHVASQAITTEAIIALTNESRKSEYLQPLQARSQLTQAATTKARDMIDRGYFSHESPDGKQVWGLLDDVRYPYTVAGENLAIHFTEAEELTGKWMTSPSHRSNILDPRYHDIGVGIAKGFYEGKPTIAVVQLFGSTIPQRNGGILHYLPGRSIAHAATTHDLFGSPLTFAKLGRTSDGIITMILTLITFLVLSTTIIYAWQRKTHHGHLTILHAFGIIATGVVVILW